MIARTVTKLAASILVLGSWTATLAFAASLDTQLQRSLQRIVTALDDPRVSAMSKAEKAELASCMFGVMSKLPAARKQYIVEASGAAELKSRFDEVSSENKFAVERSVRKACAALAKPS